MCFLFGMFPLVELKLMGEKKHFLAYLHGSKKRCHEKYVGVRTDPWIRKSEKTLGPAGGFNR
jgi:hypothetical protein